MIEVKTSDFRSAVSLAAMIPERRSTIPILQTLRCRANGALEVAATDLDMTMAVSVPRGGETEADFTIGDYHFISKALGASGEKSAGFAVGDGRLSIEAGSLSIAVKHSLPADDWPADCGAVSQEVFTATLSPEHLRQIGRIVPAISKEETRYYLTGIHLHRVDGWTYRAVATDGRRLMFVDLELPDASGDLPENVIIPRKAVSVLLRALAKSTDPIRMAGGFGTIANRETTTAPDRAGAPRFSFAGKLRTANVQLSTKTIDGTYPDYKRVVPKEQPVRAVFKIADLRRAVQAVSHDGGKVRAIKLELANGTAKLTSYYAETSVEAGIAIPVEHNAPVGFEIGFNGQYLLDMAGALTGSEIVFEMADSAAPVVMRDPADTAFTGVQMPMRV